MLSNVIRGLVYGHAEHAVNHRGGPFLRVMSSVNQRSKRPFATASEPVIVEKRLLLPLSNSLENRAFRTFVFALSQQWAARFQLRWCSARLNRSADACQPGPAGRTTSGIGPRAAPAITIAAMIKARASLIGSLSGRPHVRHSMRQDSIHALAPAHPDYRNLGSAIAPPPPPIAPLNCGVEVLHF